MKEPRPRRRPFSFPILLVLFGIHFLAYNLGWTDWSPWLAMFTLWPLLLVAFGLDLILARRNRWLAMAVSVAVLGGLVALAAHGRSGGFERPPGEQVDHAEVPLDEAETGRVQLDLHSTDLRLLPAAESPTDLVRATLFGQQRARLSSRFTQSAGTTSATLVAGHRGHSDFYPGHWRERAARLDLVLNPEVPLDLRVDGDSSDLDLDLAQLLLDQLDVDLVVGSAEVELPVPHGRASADFDMQLASLVLRVPEGTAARIRVRRTLSSVSVDTDRFASSGRYFESPDFDAAENRWTIIIRTRLGSVRVR